MSVYDIFNHMTFTYRAGCNGKWPSIYFFICQMNPNKWATKNKRKKERAKKI